MGNLNNMNIWESPFVMSRTDAQNGLLIIYNLHILKFDVFEREKTLFMHNNILNTTLD